MLKKRIQWFEIHDQSWCPSYVRDALTNYLQFMENLLHLYSPVVPLLCEAIKRTGDQRIVDLCSGGSGPWASVLIRLEAALERPIEVVLTDKFPNTQCGAYWGVDNRHCVKYLQNSIDATRVPPSLIGFRTLFGAFHHFPPYSAQQIINDAVRGGQGIGIFEVSDRKGLTCLLEAVGGLSIFLLAPFIRPFKWSHLILTYLLPVLPFLVVFDGFVSCLRTYSPQEVEALVLAVADHRYEWKVGRVRTPLPLMWVTYLVGYPKGHALIATPIAA